MATKFHVYHEFCRRICQTLDKILGRGSEWIKSIQKLLQTSSHHLSDKVRTFYPFVFKKPEVRNELHRYMKTLCRFQQIKQVTTLSSFVNITIMNVFSTNLDIFLLLGISFLLEAILYYKGRNSSKLFFCFKYFQDS
jgi:hypothetical protein